jgi:tRNA threonylcarbamoyladenosine biosynthesis protein TsaE
MASKPLSAADPVENAQLVLHLASPEATFEFGRRLGNLLFPGACIGLVGPLGAGKTQLVRAVAEGLGIPDSRVVSSPTFVLVQEYEARLPIYHFDTYRLQKTADFMDLGVQEYFDGDGVCLIEWADRVQDCLPSERLTITLGVTGPTTRLLEAQALLPKHVAILHGLAPAGTR